MRPSAREHLWHYVSCACTLCGLVVSFRSRVKKLRIAIMMSNYLQMEGSNWSINQYLTSWIRWCFVLCYSVLWGARQDVSCWRVCLRCSVQGLASGTLGNLLSKLVTSFQPQSAGWRVEEKTEDTVLTALLTPRFFQGGLVKCDLDFFPLFVTLISWQSKSHEMWCTG